MTNRNEQFQNDIKLIQEVQRYSNLYDSNHMFRDIKSKEKSWSLIGKKLNLAPDICKNRWKNLRDKYTREKKLMMIEGVETYGNHPWPLLEEMSFLWNFVSHRKRPNNRMKAMLDLQTNNHYPESYDSLNHSNSYDCDDIIKRNILDPACVLVEEDTPLESADEDKIAHKSKLRKLLESKEDVLDEQTDNSTDIRYDHGNKPVHLMDEEVYFCLSLAACFKRLPKQTGSLLKIKIMQMLHDAEFGDKTVT